MKQSSLIIIIITLFIGCKKSDALLEKLNNNQQLLEKYDKFKEEGTNKEIDFSENIIENVIDTALSYLGTPNKYGAINKDGIDASGLVYVSITKNTKVKFPRIAQDMARYGKPITKSSNLKRGDLVFFFNTYEVNRIITSVGIYIGNGEFIHSSSSKGVTISDIDDPYYWRDRFFYGTRVLR